MFQPDTLVRGSPCFSKHQFEQDTFSNEAEDRYATRILKANEEMALDFVIQKMKIAYDIEKKKTKYMNSRFKWQHYQPYKLLWRSSGENIFNVEMK